MNPNHLSVYVLFSNYKKSCLYFFFFFTVNVHISTNYKVGSQCCEWVGRLHMENMNGPSSIFGSCYHWPVALGMDHFCIRYSWRRRVNNKNNIVYFSS